MTAATALANSLLPAARPREILVLRRAKGYLRLHVPPLLYVPALARRLQSEIESLHGVRKVNIQRNRALVSVFYDPWLTDDGPALLEIDRQATPLLGKMDEEAFTETLQNLRAVRLKKLGGKVAKGSYLGALVWVHWYVMRRWLRYPGYHWWAWALIGAGVVIHLKQIRSIPKLS